jgi:hypothetical protein
MLHRNQAQGDSGLLHTMAPRRLYSPASLKSPLTTGPDNSAIAAQPTQHGRTTMTTTTTEPPGHLHPGKSRFDRGLTSHAGGSASRLPVNPARILAPRQAGGWPSRGFAAIRPAASLSTDAAAALPGLRLAWSSKHARNSAPNPSRG